MGYFSITYVDTTTSEPNLLFFQVGKTVPHAHILPHYLHPYLNCRSNEFSKMMTAIYFHEGSEKAPMLALYEQVDKQMKAKPLYSQTNAYPSYRDKGTDYT